MAGGRHGSSSRGLSKPCALLIVIAGMERYAFKGVASNLVTYLTDVVRMSNSRAAKTVNSWGGFTSMLPLLVAPLADSHWDRSSTILASSSLYFLGLVGLTSTALAGSWSTNTTSITNTISSSFLFCSLCLISLGQGAFNPSLQAFGADQLDHDIDQELPTTTSKDHPGSNHKTRFFQCWYFGVCTGSLLGVTVMAYIQDTFGWVLGFAIPSIAMLLSIALFLCGSELYGYTSGLDLKTNPFQRFLQIIKARGWSKLRSKITLSSGEDLEAMELELQQKPLHQCSNTSTDSATSANGLDHETSKISFPQLRNAKVVLRLLPIWTTLLMFAVIFQQPATFFTKQGMTMKRNIGADFKIPPATLQSAITLSIILLMPLYDKILIPITRKITGNEKGISVMQRMGVGMALSIVAMAIAAVVETKRLEISKKMKTLPQQDPGAVSLSIFWLLPQYILLGISDIFTVVGMQEFFYNEVPVRMRTMGFALYTSVFGVGSFTSAALISAVEAFSGSRGKHSWFSDDMTEARLDKYYWLLAFASAISMLLYIVLCKFFKNKSDEDDGDGT